MNYFEVTIQMYLCIMFMYVVLNFAFSASAKKRHEEGGGW